MPGLARLALLLAAAVAASAQARRSEAERPATVAAIALAIRSRAIQDSRCYLMNGGAVESFYIAEDTPVGSVIGSLRVNGDPSVEGGNITLRLQERSAGVSLVAGSKNLTLARALDREEKNGPSNLYVNVRCDRRGTTDPSFIIPVSVRVWDVNDNAPAWVGAPYRASVSELAAPGARLLALRAADRDQPGPHATVRYSILPGPYSEYFSFPNELEGTLVVRKPLDYEEVREVTLGLRAQDAGSPPRHNDTTLHVTVLDADDHNPKFTHEHYSATLPDDAKEGTIIHTTPGPISAKDQDLGINAPLHYSATGDNAHLISVNKDTGELSVTAQLLAEPEQAHTFVIKARQVDNPDRYGLSTVSVRRASAASAASVAGVAGGAGGAAGVRFARGPFAAAVREDARPGAVLLTLHTDPPPTHHKPLQFYVSERSFLDKFAINGAGELLLRRALDYETADSYLYQVMVTDGISNDTASINISVVNVNEWEPRFRYPQYEFSVEAGGAGGAGGAAGGLLPVGRLDVHDGDAPDTVALHLKGPHASMFTVQASGELFLRQEAARAAPAELHVVATAVDSGDPPRQTSVPVIVHVSDKAGAARGGLTAGLGAALAALLALVAALLIYIYTSRRRSKQSSSNSKKSFVSQEKPASALGSPPPSAGAVGATGGSTAGPGSGGPGGGGPGAGGPGGGGSGSLLSVSAGASTILANSSSSLDLADHDPPTNVAAGRTSQRTSRSKVAPQPPSGGPSGPGGPGGAHMSDHLAARAGRSGVAWPSATIPARVKKLSWGDDAAPHTQGSAESGPLTDATNTALADMNLTVYF